jgi:polyhydroxyalkanoate synthesis regulator phasin
LLRENVAHEREGDIDKKEQRRLMVLNQVERGDMAGKEAAEVLSLSLRQVRRILRHIERRAPRHWHMAIEGENLTTPCKKD